MVNHRGRLIQDKIEADLYDNLKTGKDNWEKEHDKEEPVVFEGDHE